MLNKPAIHVSSSYRATIEISFAMPSKEGSIERPVTSHRKQRTTFDQISEFDRGRIAAYQDCGLSFRNIGSRVGRNQTTVIRICDRWMQEGTTDRCGRSHPPDCTTSREEGWVWVAEWNEVVFTDESHICLQLYDGRIQAWRCRGEWMLNNCVMQRHTDTAPGIVGFVTAIFQLDNARPHLARVVQRFFVNHQTELLPWPARTSDLSPTENMWSMVAQRLTQITLPAATPDQLWQRVEAAWSAVS
ncbi:transposable element Tcb1 transposase [Trichonephila clavipes]|uniref:Transposable element Tcb1 transposase n=1 Tax=Trichonephila clavipes TaxID=2585209 RepID=A0A8X6SS85_TRICX|nr:transposable element Tcb1 transposase [Trichonephila clavipes]